MSSNIDMYRIFSTMKSISESIKIKHTNLSQSKYSCQCSNSCVCSQHFILVCFAKHKLWYNIILICSMKVSIYSIKTLFFFFAWILPYVSWGLKGAFLIVITVLNYVKLNNRVTKELQYMYMLSTYNRNILCFKTICKDTSFTFKKNHLTSKSK